MRIRWTTPATKQLAAAYDYIAEENPRAARKITMKIWEAVELLGRHPGAGRKGRVPGTRELVILGTPFIVAYQVERNELQVLAVLHTARKWPEEF